MGGLRDKVWCLESFGGEFDSAAKSHNGFREALLMPEIECALQQQRLNRCFDLLTPDKALVICVDTSSARVVYRLALLGAVGSGPENN